MPVEPFFFDASEVSPNPTGRKRGKTKKIKSMGCEDCGLYLNCKSPKMGLYGKGRLGILVVGKQPGEQEDEEGRPFVGPSGLELTKTLRRLGVSLTEDCWATNSMQCYSEEEANENCRYCCLSRLDRQIRELKPDLIICVGGEAVSSVLGRSIAISKIRGRVIPSRRYNAWVASTFHPSYILRQEYADVAAVFRRLVTEDLRLGLEHLDQPVGDRFLDENRGNHWITDPAQAIEMLDYFSRVSGLVAFDYETNQLSPFQADSKVILIGLTDKEDEGWSLSVPDPLDDEFKQAVQRFLSSDVMKIAYNAQFEALWSKNLFDVWPYELYEDPMLTAHVLDERKKTKSLAWQTFVGFGTEFKQEFGKRSEMVADARTARYNSLDVRYTYALSRFQYQQLDPFLVRGQQILNMASEPLADMTHRGVRLDKGKLLGLREEARESIQSVEQKLIDSDAVRDTEALTGRMFTFSEEDVRSLFYKVLGLAMRN